MLNWSNMQILIMRHGDALMNAASDSLRKLSRKGIEQSLEMGCWLQQFSIDTILVSPYLRAQQTCTEINRILQLQDRVRTEPALTPDGNVAAVFNELTQLALEGKKRVLLISHLPFVGYLINQLCPDEIPPIFATSAIAEVEFNLKDKNKFIQLVSPHQLM